ncbi:hypothetical protein Lsed01_00865 [Demequina sediminis]|uniref:Uncharacterized protein n=1 Tax=Demequina sediminis TaxID=1930058 RepID=A0ABP9WF47_9MICO|nr:hypothetical protein [Demequina sediminis]BDZ62481.1 hypothetical protein GCM10025873_22720 [Demequina sediminis]
MTNTSISTADLAADERLSALRQLCDITARVANPGPDDYAEPVKFPYFFHEAAMHGVTLEHVPAKERGFIYEDADGEPVSEDHINALIRHKNAAESLCDFVPLGPLELLDEVSEAAGYRLRASEFAKVDCGTDGRHEFLVDSPFGFQATVYATLEGHIVVGVGVPEK